MYKWNMIDIIAKAEIAIEDIIHLSRKVYHSTMQNPGAPAAPGLLVSSPPPPPPEAYPLPVEPELPPDPNGEWPPRPPATPAPTTSVVSLSGCFPAPPDPGVELTAWPPPYPPFTDRLSKAEFDPGLPPPGLPPAPPAPIVTV